MRSFLLRKFIFVLSLMVPLFYGPFATASSSVQTNAQSFPTAKIEGKSSSSAISKGIKIGIGGGVYDFKSKESVDYNGITDTYQYNSDSKSPMVSLSLGYDHIRKNLLGFSTDFSYLKGQDPIKNNDYSIAAFSFNSTYGLTVPVHFYLGLNLSRVLTGRTLKDPGGGEVQPLGFGGQFGGGYNFTENIQLTLGYQQFGQQAEYQIDGKKIGDIRQTESSIVTSLNLIF